MNIETKEIIKKKTIIKFDKKDYECLNQAAELLNHISTTICKIDMNSDEVLTIAKKDMRMLDILYAIKCDIGDIYRLFDTEDDDIDDEDY